MDLGVLVADGSYLRTLLTTEMLKWHQVLLKVHFFSFVCVFFF